MLRANSFQSELGVAQDCRITSEIPDSVVVHQNNLIRVANEHGNDGQLEI